MVADGRLVVRLRPQRAYGMARGLSTDGRAARRSSSRGRRPLGYRRPTEGRQR